MDETVVQLADQQVLGTEVWRIVALCGVIFLGYLLGKLTAWFLKTLEKRSAETRPILGIVFASLSAGLGLLGLLVGVKVGLVILNPEPRFANIGFVITDVLVVIVIGWIAFKLVDIPYSLYERWSLKQQSKLTDMVGPLLRTSLRIVVVILTLLQVAQVVSDQPLTSLIAGLGVGGLAVALAAQDSIKHFFGSIVIFADRPFEVGDRIVVEGFDGPVEEVGFRSTRLRNLDGHLVTIPNGELVNKIIQNIGKRPHIRRLFTVGITYDTPPEKVQRAKDIILELLKDHEGIHPEFPPRAFFNEFGSTSLNILVMYWYHPPAYWDYMAFSEHFNMQLLQRFNDEGIEFAFPTQTLFLAGDPNRPLEVGVKPPSEAPGSSEEAPPA